MSFAIFKGETSLKDLVSRLFGFSSKSSPTQVQQAEKALLQANPQLQDMSKVPVGSVISVPAEAPPLRTAEDATAIVSRRAAIATQAQQTLERINQQLTEIETSGTSAANALLALAQSTAAQTTAQPLPELKTDMPAVIASLQSTIASIKPNQDARAQAIAGLRTSLQSFAKSKG
jgi:cell division septum initiation protein DivIVA